MLKPNYQILAENVEEVVFTWETGGFLIKQLGLPNVKEINIATPEFSGADQFAEQLKAIENLDNKFILIHIPSPFGSTDENGFTYSHCITVYFDQTNKKIRVNEPKYGILDKNGKPAAFPQALIKILTQENLTFYEGVEEECVRLEHEGESNCHWTGIWKAWAYEKGEPITRKNFEKTTALLMQKLNTGLKENFRKQKNFDLVLQEKRSDFLAKALATLIFSQKSNISSRKFYDDGNPHLIFFWRAYVENLAVIIKNICPDYVALEECFTSFCDFSHGSWKKGTSLSENGNKILQLLAADEELLSTVKTSHFERFKEGSLIETESGDWVYIENSQSKYLFFQHSEPSDCDGQYVETFKIVDPDDISMDTFHEYDGSGFEQNNSELANGDFDLVCQMLRSKNMIPSFFPRKLNNHEITKILEFPSVKLAKSIFDEINKSVKI